MTERPRDELEQDRALRDAYARASQELPPPALDDAIRAAARRAVHAKPGDGTRRRRNGAAPWWPLAVAATLAAVTFGITELLPVDRSDADMRETLRPEAGAASEAMPSAPAPAPPAAAPPSSPPAVARPSPPPVQTKPSPSGEAPTASVPRAAPSVNVVPSARPQPDATNAQRSAAKPAAQRRQSASDAPAPEVAGPAPSRTPPQAFPDAASSRTSGASDAAPPPEAPLAARMATGAPAAKAAPPYAGWLADIEALLARGDEAKARSELAKLLERYPEALPGLPDKLRPLAPTR